jgi:dinuclear metal center YbgI/SA1388 family protein
MTALRAIAEHLDALLRTPEVPDYPGALNGIQLENRGEIRRLAAAVDFSRRTVESTIAAGANLLIVHHGMFWGGPRPIRGSLYDRLHPLFAHDVAVYASHIPLDLHPSLGNNVLLARELGLEPSGGFGRYQTVQVGVRGEGNVATTELVERARGFARSYGGDVVATPHDAARRTRRWAIVTGAGASSETLREAAGEGVDTLIVGEGPHHTAVEAEELGLVVVYAGHYATETLGVQALAREVERAFRIPWSFVGAPTGL